MIAVAAILVVAGVAAPIYFNSRISALESAVTAELLTIHRAQSQCLAQSGRYCETLAALGPDGARLAAGTPHGYLFNLSRSESGYTASAAPQPYYGFARRTVHLDQTGEIRYSWSTVRTEEVSEVPAR